MSIIIVPDPEKLGESIAETVDKHGGCSGCITKLFVVVLIFAAVIGVVEFGEEFSKKKSDKKWERIVNLSDSVRKEERIFTINNQEKKKYKIKGADEISQINEMLGLQNDGTGFYFAGNGNKFIMGIKLKSWTYDRYYARISVYDLEYSTRENDLTIATFRSKNGSNYLSFEEVVRLKRFDIEQEDVKEKNSIPISLITMFISFIIMGVGVFIFYLMLTKRNRTKK